MDTIRIVAEKRAIEIGADFNVYTRGGQLTARGLDLASQVKISGPQCAF